MTIPLDRLPATPAGAATWRRALEQHAVSTAERDDAIRRAFVLGYRQTAIAEAFGLTQGRVSQIIGDGRR